MGLSARPQGNQPFGMRSFGPRRNIPLGTLLELDGGALLASRVSVITQFDGLMFTIGDGQTAEIYRHKKTAPVSLQVPCWRWAAKDQNSSSVQSPFHGS